jgi:hypothetical protein
MMFERSAFFLLPIAAAAMVIVAGLSGCGGGGGDSPDGGDVEITDDPAPPMPVAVNFGIGTKAGAPLTLTSGPISISYPLLSFNGTWDRNAKAYTLSGGTGTSSGPSLFGTFASQLVEPLAWVGSTLPTRGKIESITPAGNSFFLPDPVQSTVTSTGLTLTYPGVTPLAVDWDRYIGLWAEVPEQPDHWRLASFGGATVALAIERMTVVLELMAFINGNDQAIAASGAAGLVTACSPRPGASTGTRRIALTNPDGEFNPGDGLTVTYNNCWIDDPADDVDILRNGTITLSLYIENATPFSTGFDEFRFDALTDQETETAGGVVTVDPTAIVTTGTLTLFVTP